MNGVLENSFFQLKFDLEKSTWSVEGRQESSPVLEGARLSVSYRLEGGPTRILDRWPTPSLAEHNIQTSPHGPMQRLCLESGSNSGDLRALLTFALPEGHPVLLWKLSLNNPTPHPIAMERLDLLRIGENHDPNSRITFHGSRIPTLNSPLSTPFFYSNGWQSWSFAGTYASGDRPSRSRLGPFRLPAEASHSARQSSTPGHFSSDLFGVIGYKSLHSALLAGFLSQRQHFGSLEARLDLPDPQLSLWADGDGARLDPGEKIETDWACLAFLDLDSEDPFGPYLDAVARENDIPDHFSRFTTEEIPTGWCSWYQYSSEDYIGDLSESDIRRNLQDLSRLRERLSLEVVQIDDGFEAQVGDWFDFAPSFPQGVAPLAAEIRAAGYKPGLWLAPFIVHQRSRLAAEHPDWLLRGKLGWPSNAGFLWNTFASGLDLTHSDALAYAAETVHTAVHDWGFSYLKLDFLYAAALPAKRRDPRCTRAQALRKGLVALRAAAGEETYLVGCGCPLGSAIGLVDAMRIGADVDRRWTPAIHRVQAIFDQEPGLPSARNAIHNTLTRAAFHRRWWVNDPDCLLLRPEMKGSRGSPAVGTSHGRSVSALTLSEVQSLATVISLSGGSLLLSDDLAALPAERLRLAEALIPLVGKAPRVLDWFDPGTPSRLRLDLDGAAGAWRLLALFNWEGRPVDLDLKLEEYDMDPASEYFAREFWSSRLFRVQGGMLHIQQVPAHGVALFTVRPVLVGIPQYVGSSLHISQGLEVVGWEEAPGGAGGLSLRLERPGLAQGSIDLSLPAAPVRASLAGRPLDFQSPAEGVWRFTVDFARSASIHLTWAELDQE